VVAVCDQQQGKTRPPVTVTFRSFTPQPNGLEFKAGQDYYFISALLGHQGDPQRRFSPCREHNMKVIFKVCCKPAASSQRPGPNASLLAPAQQRAQQPALQQQQSTRRPPVITLRPSLLTGGQQQSAGPAEPAAAHAARQPAAQAGLEEYLRNLAPGAAHFGPSAGQQQQQQAQPMTVLPIEVLQPSSEAPPQQDSQEGGERNDIVQNEQQPPPTAPTLLRPPPPPPRAPALFPFDPTAPPEILRSYERWAPTPLPPALTRGQQRNQPQQQQPQQALPGLHMASLMRQQHQQLEQPAPWQLPPQQRPPLQRAHSQQQQQQSEAAAARPSGQSRMSLYPHSVWSTTCKYPPKPLSSPLRLSLRPNPQSLSLALAGPI